MKNKIFNSKIDSLYVELKKSYIKTIENEFQDGQNAAINRVFSLLKEKKQYLMMFMKILIKKILNIFFMTFFYILRKTSKILRNE